MRKNYLFLLFDQAVFSGNSFIVTILVARHLSLASFGLYSSLVLGMYLVTSLISALVIQPFQVRGKEFAQETSYLSFTFWLQVVLAALGVAVAYPFLVYFGFADLFVYTIPLFLGFTFHDFARKFFLAKEQIERAVSIDFSLCVGQISVMVYFYLNRMENLDLLLLVLGATYALPFLISTYFIRPFNIQPKYWSDSFAYHFKEGKWLVSTAMIQWWSGNYFVVASGLYLGVEAIGALRLAQSLFGVLNLLLQAFENYILPQTANRMNSSKELATHFLADNSIKAAFLFFPVLVLIFFFAEPIFGFVGGEMYIPYAYLLRGLTVLYTLIYINQPIRIAIRALMLNQYFFYGYLINLLFMLSSSHFLLMNYDLMGAVAGLIIAQSILIVYWINVLRIKKFYLWKSFI